jgi:cobalt/nickel transport system permease protein
MTMTKRTRGVVLAGLLVALLLAGFGSYYASSSPDGLAKVAIDKGLDKGEQDHTLGESPLAGYSLKGVDNKRLSGGLAGIAGVGLTFLLGGAIAVAVRRRGPRSGQDGRHAEQATGGGGARP